MNADAPSEQLPWLILMQYYVIVLASVVCTVNPSGGCLNTLREPDGLLVMVMMPNCSNTICMTAAAEDAGLLLSELLLKHREKPI